MTASTGARFDDRLRVLLTVFAVVVSVTVPPWWPHGLLALVLLGLVLLSGNSARAWLRRCLLAMPVLLVIGLLVPFS